MQYFSSCNGIVYTIRQGDTLYSISGRFRVPLALILRANPYVEIYNLQIGAKLCIPMFGCCRTMTYGEGQTMIHEKNRMQYTDNRMDETAGQGSASIFEPQERK